MFHWDSRSCSLLCNIFFPLGWGKKVLYDLKLKEGSPWQANRKPQSFRSKPTRTVLNLLQAGVFLVALTTSVTCATCHVVWGRAEASQRRGGAEGPWEMGGATCWSCPNLEQLQDTGPTGFECIWMYLNVFESCWMKSALDRWSRSECFGDLLKRLSVSSVCKWWCPYREVSKCCVLDPKERMKPAEAGPFRRWHDYDIKQNMKQIEGIEKGPTVQRGRSLFLAVGVPMSCDLQCITSTIKALELPFFNANRD